MFRRTQLLTIFLLVAMVIAACGGTAPSTGSTTSPSAAASEQAAPASVAAEASVSEAAEASVSEAAEAAPTATVAVLENTVVAPSEAAAASTPSDMAADQTLRYVTRGFSRMDPASEGGFGRFVISHMWMPLFLRDTENTLMPWLATGYEVNDDKTVYTVSIDPRAVWSDGSPVLAQEAIDYWAYGLDPVRCEGCYLSAFAGFDVIEGAKDVIDGNSQTISGITATDEKTLEFNADRPRSALYPPVGAVRQRLRQNGGREQGSDVCLRRLGARQRAVHDQNLERRRENLRDRAKPRVVGRQKALDHQHHRAGSRRREYLVRAVAKQRSRRSAVPDQYPRTNARRSG